MQALDDIRVIDLTRVLAGPFCTQLLADHGADVIKIEQPGTGDGTRQWGPPWIGDQSAYFLSVNRNKRSVVLNLKSPDGMAILRELLVTADVLIENFLPGTLADLGLTFEGLRKEFPKLVVCSITGYGQTGPYRDRAGYDFAIQAQGGLMSVTGPVDGEPTKVGVAVADITTGLYAANAIMTALHARGRTGQGQLVDVALLDSQIGWLINLAQNYFATGKAPGRIGNDAPSIVPYRSFATSEGFLVLAVGADGQYRRLCEALERPDLWNDTRFQTNPGRVQHREELVKLLGDVFATRSTSHWCALLTPIGVPCAPINDIPTALADPQVVAREMVQTVHHPTLGEIKVIGPVAKLSETPASVRMAPPLLGEHTEAVLRDMDIGNEWLAELISRGAIQVAGS